MADLAKKGAVVLAWLVCLAGGKGCVGDGGVGQGEVAGIVGGEETGYLAWQGVVAVEAPFLLCSGVLVDPEVVLTAAHCVQYSGRYDLTGSPEDLQILGGADLEEPLALSGVSEVVLHPGWPGELVSGDEVDLALLRLDAALGGTEHYSVRSAPQVEPGQLGKIAGYGVGIPGDLTSDGVHRVGDTTILELTENAIEIGDPAGTCFSDSGGPLFTAQSNAWVVSGVASFMDDTSCDPLGGSWCIEILDRRPWLESWVQTWTGHGLLPGASDVDTDIDTDSDPADSGLDDAAGDDGGSLVDGDTDTGPTAKSFAGCSCRAVGRW